MLSWRIKAVSEKYIYIIFPLQAGILLVHDRRPDEKEVLVEAVQPHGPGISGRSGAGGAGGKAKASGSSGAGALGTRASDAGAQSDAAPIHAATVGALIEGEFAATLRLYRDLKNR